MSKTPSRTSDLMLQTLSPIEVVSLSKGASGISKTFYTHVTSLHELLTNWKRVREKGTKICKAICALQQRDSEEKYYSSQLEQLTTSLLNALESLRHVVEGIQTINEQMNALAQLHPKEEPVISTWCSSHISENITTILDLLQKEYVLKEVITENIAHTQDDNLLELYASAWEFDTYINDDCSAYLFAEFGLPGVT